MAPSHFHFYEKSHPTDNTIHISRLQLLIETLQTAYES